MIRKIDFIEQLKKEGFRIIIPKEVIEELKDLKNNLPHNEKTAINLAIELIEKNKLEKMKLSKGKVDDALISLGKKGAYIATLDSAIKNIIPNKIGISSAKNAILIERN